MAIPRKRAGFVLSAVIIVLAGFVQRWADATFFPEPRETPSPYGTGDPKLAAANMAGGPIDPFLTDGNAVLLALGEIAKQSGKPLRVISMWADSTDGLTVDVQRPHHVNVERYSIAPDGALAAPQLVRMPSPSSERGSAFDPRAIAFARMTPAVRQAIVKSKFPDSRVSAWQVDGAKPNDHVYVYLQAAHARPIAVLDPHFNLVRIQY